MVPNQGTLDPVIRPNLSVVRCPLSACETDARRVRTRLVPPAADPLFRLWRIRCRLFRLRRIRCQLAKGRPQGHDATAWAMSHHAAPCRVTDARDMTQKPPRQSLTASHVAHVACFAKLFILRQRPIRRRRNNRQRTTHESQRTTQRWRPRTGTIAKMRHFLRLPNTQSIMACTDTSSR